MTEFHFVKSSYSTQSGECIEVALNIPGTVAVQDSKSPSEGTVRLTPAAWAAFTAGLVGGSPQS